MVSERVGDVGAAARPLAPARRGLAEAGWSPRLDHLVVSSGLLGTAGLALGLAAGCWLLPSLVGWLICVVALGDLTVLTVGNDRPVRRRPRAAYRSLLLLCGAAGALSAVRVGRLHTGQVPTLAMGTLGVLVVVLAFLISRLRDQRRAGRGRLPD